MGNLWSRLLDAFRSRPPPELSSGKAGEDVRDLQAQLNRRGAKLDEDGIFGPKTKRAVAEFQKSKGLVKDGVVGEHTWRELEDK